MSSGLVNPVCLERVADACGGKLIGDPAATVFSVSSLEDATPDSLTFMVDSSKLAENHGINPGVILLKPEDSGLFSGPRIVVADPYLAYATVSELFATGFKEIGVHSSAVIDPSVSLGSNVRVGAHAVIAAHCQLGDGVLVGANTVIERDCSVGADSVIDSSVTIYTNTRIGMRCRISSGAVLGASGFGYAPDGHSWRRIEQLGGVRIGDDVDIGANTTIDRGTIGDTLIGHRVKLDNLIHIAHNVKVGDDTIMAACVGIAGSADIGKRCRIGGRSSINGHIIIVDDVVLHALAFVTKSITVVGEYTSAVPAQPARQWRRTLAHLNRLDKLVERIKKTGNKND